MRKSTCVLYKESFTASISFAFSHELLVSFLNIYIQNLQALMQFRIFSVFFLIFRIQTCPFYRCGNRFIVLAQIKISPGMQIVYCNSNLRFFPSFTYVRKRECLHGNFEPGLIVFYSGEFGATEEPH